MSKKRWLVLLIVALLALMFVVPAQAKSKRKSKIKLNKTSVTLKKGKTIKLKVKGTKKKVKWSTLNKRVATVTKKGVVKGIKPGKTIIKAKVAGKTLKCRLTVIVPNRKQDKKINGSKDTEIKDTEQPISVTKVEFFISDDKIRLDVGQTREILYLIYPYDAKDQTLNWTSSDTNVATVDASGNVTAVSTGTATITATASNGVKNTVEVVVCRHGYSDDDYILMAALAWIAIQEKGDYSYYIDYRQNPIKIRVDSIYKICVDTNGAIQILYDTDFYSTAYFIDDDFNSSYINCYYYGLKEIHKNMHLQVIRWTVPADGQFITDFEIPISDVAAKVIELKNEGKYLIN